MLYVGTSGFSYPEWRGTFYPESLSGEEMLRFYSGVFATVELNNTFYRFPTPSQVERWRKGTPRGFRFSVKAHRSITHNRRLRNAEDYLRILIERVDALKDRRGPILFQLPPTLRADRALLEDFLCSLPPMLRAVEFRDHSWYTEDIFALLEEHRTALTVMESDEDEPVLRFVGPFAYFRLHRYRYTDEQLLGWAERTRWFLSAGKDVYAYFTHEEDTPGPEYARRLQALVEGNLQAAGDAPARGQMSNGA